MKKLIVLLDNSSSMQNLMASGISRIDYVRNALSKGIKILNFVESISI